MKQIFLSLAVLVFIGKSFGQAPAPTRDDYLKKAKTQKTFGWVMLGGGIAMATTGILIANKKEDDYLTSVGNKGLGVVLEVAGLGAAFGSIPFFASAAKNKRKAATLSFNTQRVLFPEQGAFVLKMQPALVLKIGL
jgi:hypothetical protein